MIYFDLDGVIRWLSYNLRNGNPPMYWDEPLPNGEDMCNYIHNNLSVLEDAPPTLYYDVIKRLPKIPIITNQFPGWKIPTRNWINKYFPLHLVTIQYVNPTEKKLDFLKNGDLIVEDYPFFPDYSKVILIDWPYNRNVADPYMRVRTPKQLSDFLGV